jgi:amino acid adenylation domain-containing protein
LLGAQRVGRNDHFFELGGHSLMVVRMVAALRAQGWHADVGSVFTAGTVSGLAALLTPDAAPRAAAPPNRIPDGCRAIVPDMLPLVTLSQADIDLVVARIPGGASNVQDIYPLGPLQSGILFHHLLETEGDTYLLRTALAFDRRDQLDGFMEALQCVIDRHDILRTAFVSDGLAQPVQVVCRSAPLPVVELALDPVRPALEQMLERVDPRRMRLHLAHAPLLGAWFAADTRGTGWYLVLMNHHLVGDHVSVEAIVEEVQLLLADRATQLAPPQPYREFISQVMATDAAAHETYFRTLLGDVDEPTAPFGLLDVRGATAVVSEARQPLAAALAKRIRAAARRHGVLPAVLFHVAWARVLGSCTGRDDVVFGTVLLGRSDAVDSARMLGMFVNTLPVRLHLAHTGVPDAVAQMSRQLGALLGHEQAPLTLAQRCSALPPQAPLFTTLLNFRHAPPVAHDGKGLAAFGMRVVSSQERANYPVTVSVDDDGAGFAVGAQCAGVDPQRIAMMLVRAVEGVAAALDAATSSWLHALDVLGPDEHAVLLHAGAGTSAAYPPQRLIHQVFEAQAAAQPGAMAVDDASDALSYAELNRRANQVAHRLRALGIGVGDRVAICSRRDPHLIVGLLGILKAGAGYVPLDPAYPAERLAFMLADSQPKALLSGTVLAAALAEAAAAHGTPQVVLDTPCERSLLAALPDTNPDASAQDGASLAYVIYTSGSTGQPKGTQIEHRSVLRLAVNADFAPIGPGDCIAHCASPSFDASTWEIWAALLNGARLLPVAQEIVLDPGLLNAALLASGVTALWLTAGLFNEYVDALELAFSNLRYLLVGGDALDPRTVRRALGKARPPRHFINGYGPTESTTFACTHEVTAIDAQAARIPIGRPIANTSIHILDCHGQPVPVGVPGEIHIGGDGLARGYLNRPDLTAARFVTIALAGAGPTRLYKTGDIGLLRPDGVIECLGRNDAQVKIRGFRIEPGEIEACLAACPGVTEAVVLARSEEGGTRRLVGYLLGDGTTALAPGVLRAQLQSVLPDYMVPAAYVVLDAFPLTPNGKLDRAALPAPGLAALATRPYHPPQGPAEMALVLIWQDLLGLDRVGRDDHFFALGGHSLLAVQLMGRVRSQCHVELSLKTLFETPILCQLAALVTELQFTQFMGAAAAELKNELGALSESELLAVLAEESLTDE